jgi:hypothetical protein
MSKDNTIRRMQDDAIVGYTKYEGGIPIVKTLNFHKPLYVAWNYCLSNLGILSCPIDCQTWKYRSRTNRIKTILHYKTCRLKSRDPIPSVSHSAGIFYTDIQIIGSVRIKLKKEETPQQLERQGLLTEGTQVRKANLLP